ncbi:hypothetical protein ANTRET_LOCUS3925 [Anthophora retusa]
MALYDFFLFVRLKLPLRGKGFQTIEAIKENSQKKLKAIPKSAYEKCFEDWKKRWNIRIIEEEREILNERRKNRDNDILAHCTRAKYQLLTG